MALNVYGTTPPVRRHPQYSFQGALWRFLSKRKAVNSGIDFAWVILRVIRVGIELNPLLAIYWGKRNGLGLEVNVKREVLFSHKAISKIDMASIFCDIMDKLKLPALDRIGYYTYRKTKEWAEVCESTKCYFVRMVENSRGTFSLWVLSRRNKPEGYVCWLFMAIQTPRRLGLFPCFSRLFIFLWEGSMSSIA